MLKHRGRTQLAVIVLACLFAGTASADDTARAKALFKQAEQKFADSDFKEARKLYEQAYQLKPLPGFLLNIGQCHRKLGQCDKAIESYEQFLQKSNNAQLKADAKRLIEVCREELANQPAPEPEPEPAPVENLPDEKPKPKPEPEPEPERKGMSPVIFWSGVGVTGALLLTGTITGAMALSKSSKYRDLETPYEDLQGLKDSGKTLKTTSTVTFILAAAAAAATTVFYFYTDWGPKEATVAAGPVEGGGMVMVGGRF